MNTKHFIFAALGALCLTLSACAMPALPPPTASLDTIRAIRASGVAPMNVGDFVPAPGEPTEMDKSVTVRAGVQPAPDGSFAKYLGDTISAELKGAGKLDPNSTLVVSGLITGTHLDSSMSTPRAALAAKITLVRAGKVTFEKTISVESTWDANFIGAVAIPDAINHYTDLYRQLTAKLFADPDFVSAARG
jgi:hypothetical protein